MLVRPGSPGDERRLLQIDASANSSAGREQLFARACGVVADARELALVVLVDDVLYTGRTIRAALDAEG